MLNSFRMSCLGPYQKAVLMLGLLSVTLMIQESNAFEFRVGGSRGTWAVPTEYSVTFYNQWAEKNRFQIGDTLLFVYVPDKDSVLHVTKDDYTNCNTASPLEKFTDGHTVFHFNQSGPHYFISGVSDHCRGNEKLEVVVMADRSKQSSPHHSSSPPPSSAPSPAPAMAESPQYPYGPDMNPTLAPSQEFTPFSDDAASIATSVIGTIIVLVSSSLLMAF